MISRFFLSATCDTAVAVQWIIAIAALMAAVLWFYAAWRGRSSFLNTPMDQIERDFKAQSHFNALAAIATGVAAFAQALSTQLPICADKLKPSITTEMHSQKIKQQPCGTWTTFELLLVTQLQQ